MALGLVVRAVVGGDVGRPLVRLGQDDRAGELLVDHPAQVAQVGVRLREVLAVGALLLEEVGHGVEPEAVDAEPQPEACDVLHRVPDLRVLEVEVRLVAEEAVPEVLAADRVEGPVGRLRVHEDDAGVLVAGGVVAPHVEVPVGAVGVGAGRLEPRVLVARVVHDQVDDHAHTSRVGLLDEGVEVREGAVLRRDRGVVGDVVAAVAHGRRVERRQPQAVHAEPLQVLESVREAPQVPGALAGRVGEAAEHDLVEHGRAVPVGVRAQSGSVLLGQDAGGRGARRQSAPRVRPADDGGAVRRHAVLTAMMWATWWNGSRRM